MTDLNTFLAEVEAREQNADSGPWTATSPTIEMGYTDGKILWTGNGCGFGEVAPSDADIGFGKRNSNAEFIIHARQDIPTLLRLVRVLMQYVEPFHEQYCARRAGVGPYCDCQGQFIFDAMISATISKASE